MLNLPNYIMVKNIIQNLTIIIFDLLSNNKPTSEVDNLVIVKEKLVVVGINLLAYYIFLKVYL